MECRDARHDFSGQMKTYYSSSSRNEEGEGRRGLTRLALAILAGACLWTSQLSHGAIVNYLGSGDLDDKKSWSTQTIPNSGDLAVFNIGNSAIGSTGSLDFGNFVWNNNTGANISLKATGITRYLTLYGAGGSGVVIAGGNTGDLLLMGNNAKTNTLKFEALPGSGDLQIRLNTDGSINVVNSGATLDLSTSVTGGKSITKTGNGTLNLGVANTYSGATTIKSGTLKANAADALGATSSIDIQGGSLLIAASNAINDRANITMGNGKLEMSGQNISERVGALTLTGNSVIDVRELQGPNNSLYFASGFLQQGWAADTRLSIWNWDFSGRNHIYFGSNASGLSAAQLNQISFYSDFGTSFIGNAFISNTGEISTIPEAQTTLAAILLLSGGVAHFMASGYVRKKRERRKRKAS